MQEGGLIRKHAATYRRRRRRSGHWWRAWWTWSPASAPRTPCCRRRSPPPSPRAEEKWKKHREMWREKLEVWRCGGEFRDDAPFFKGRDGRPQGETAWFDLILVARREDSGFSSKCCVRLFFPSPPPPPPFYSFFSIYLSFVFVLNVRTLVLINIHTSYPAITINTYKRLDRRIFDWWSHHEYLLIDEYIIYH